MRLKEIEEEKKNQSTNSTMIIQENCFLKRKKNPARIQMKSESEYIEYYRATENNSMHSMALVLCSTGNYCYLNLVIVELIFGEIFERFMNKVCTTIRSSSSSSTLCFYLFCIILCFDEAKEQRNFYAQ